MTHDGGVSLHFADKWADNWENKKLYTGLGDIACRLTLSLDCYNIVSK